MIPSGYPVNAAWVDGFGERPANGLHPLLIAGCAVATVCTGADPAGDPE